MEKVVKVSDIQKHIDQLFILKKNSETDEEYCKAIDDRVHAIIKMLDMIPQYDSVI